MHRDGSDTHLCAATMETATLITEVGACGRRGVKMERKEKNKHKSQRADNLPALERFPHSRKIHGIEPKQCRT
jgi:hypothetical protein